MMEQSNIHWTDDEELLSRFVLGHITGDEATKLAAHLDTCERCRQRVREETLLIAGVKSAGRDELKTRLKSNLAATGTSSFQISWTRIASLAAVVVILVAVGVYNNWFRTNFRTEPSVPDKIVAEGTPSKTESTNKEKKEPPPLIADERKPAPSTSPIERDRLDQSKDRDTEQGNPVTRKDEMYNYQLMAKSTSSRANEGTRITSEALKVESGGETVGQVIASTSQMFWLEGHVTSETGQAQDLSEAPSERQSMHRFARPQVQTNSMKDSKTSSTSEMQGTAVQVSLNQKPSSLLPRSLQDKQNGTVQTLFENRNNDLRMTLYLDSLLPDSELQSARVESFNGDSIVLNLQTQHIGYRLPQALQGQVNSKAKEVK